MKLNPDIQEAIRRAVDHYGNTSQFAQKIGVAHSTVLFWLSGKTANISGTIWNSKVRRELSKFMPKAERRADISKIRDSDSGNVFKSTDFSVKEQKTRRIPVVNFSLMNEFDITMQSPVSFAKKHSMEDVAFANSCTEFSFALQLDKQEYCPSLPLGTRLLIRGSDYAEDGDLTVVKTRNPAKLIFCRYCRVNEMIRLVPMNPKHHVLEWKNGENAEKVFWIFPVKEISIDLDSHCWKDNALIRKKLTESDPCV